MTNDVNAYYVRQVADILFSLLSVCLSVCVCVSVCTQSSLQQCKKFTWRIYALSERLLVLHAVIIWAHYEDMGIIS